MSALYKYCKVGSFLVNTYSEQFKYNQNNSFL